MGYGEEERAGRRRTGRCCVGVDGTAQKHNPGSSGPQIPPRLDLLGLPQRPGPCALLFPPKPEMRGGFHPGKSLRVLAGQVPPAQQLDLLQSPSVTLEYMLM